MYFKVLYFAYDVTLDFSDSSDVHGSLSVQDVTTGHQVSLEAVYPETEKLQPVVVRDTW